MSWGPGTRVGPYEVIDALGAGGMGEVYRARDSRLDRIVALKVLGAEIASSPDAHKRFEAEARAAAKLQHPNVVVLHDVGLHESSPFLVMELLKGSTLRDILGRGRLPVEKAVGYIAEAARGLAAAHDAGLVHRDIKPENLFITETGQLKILDFGIARDASGVAAAVTAPAMLIGTAGYMSPEQLRGEKADARSDVFSLGLVLFEALTGERPFKVTSMAEWSAAVLREEPPSLKGNPGVPPALDAIVQRCLAKRPADRFQSASDLAFALDQSSQRSAVVSLGAPTTPWRRVAAIAAIVLLGLATAGWFAWRRGDAAVADAPAFQRLSFDSGPEWFPNFSPDGSSVVFQGGAAGNADIYVKSVSGRSAINITEESPADDSQPALSPDGQTIAFRSERNEGGVFLMGWTGESVRRIGSGYNPAWSPDGREIVVASIGVTASPSNRTGSQSQLSILDVTSGQRRPLVTDDAVQPAWSPSGRRIAYWGLWNRNQRDIWTVAVSGGEPVRVTADSALDWNPIWSADGQWLYFVSDRSGAMNLWRIRVDETTGAVGGEPEPIILPASSVAHLRFSRDGTRMVYATFERTSHVFRARLDQNAETIDSAVTQITSGSKVMTAVSVSPDGGVLAASDTAGDGQHIVVMNSDGKDLRQVTFGPWSDRGAEWRPDAKGLIFYSNRSGRYQVWSVNVDGGNLRQITDAPANGLASQSWTRDGRILAYEPVTYEWVTLDANRRIDAPVTDRQPAFKDETGSFVPDAPSPDGKWVVGGDPGLVLRSLDRPEYRRLTAGGGSPNWLSDSRRIMFVANGRIQIVDVVTGSLRNLAHAFAVPITAVTIAPDRSRIFAIGTSVESDLWIRTIATNSATRLDGPTAPAPRPE